MIFTILKVIGIILLVVLALILTALLCVLFVPVKGIWLFGFCHAGCGFNS